MKLQEIENLTAHQLNTARVVDKHGWDNKALAKAQNCDLRTASKRLYNLKRSLARRGHAPEEGYSMLQPPGFSLKGVSTFGDVDEDGKFKPTKQWYKSDRDKEQQYESMRAAVEELSKDCYGKATRVRAPRKAQLNSDLLALYGIGDHHHGMYSWAKETGADYDCEISQRILVDAFTKLIDVAPPAEEAMVLSVGDFFHADDAKARTPQSGHVLDVDGRHTRVIQTGVRMLATVIRMALKKHKVVRFVPMPGNHDPLSTVWLAITLDSLFANEPRVIIDIDPRQYRYFQWGRCLIGTTHGDRCKPTALGEIMAADVPDLWGATKFRHWYTGHQHHRWLQELRGCFVECLPVLPPSDDWHARSGYRSDRGIQLDVWHKDCGRVTSWPVGIEYIYEKSDQ